MYCKGKDHLAKDCPKRAHLPKHGADAAHENRFCARCDWRVKVYSCNNRRWATLRADPGMDDVLGNVAVEDVVELKEKKKRAGAPSLLLLLLLLLLRASSTAAC